jgi:DNA-binding winged helix-turn-helix (wHTH) protein/Tfp pilus assembly protein PilF/TolB-like protein
MSFRNTPDFLQNLFEGEMSGPKHPKYSFRSFRLDVGERRLLKNDVPVSISPKVFDVLVELVSNSGHLVRKDELMEAVWAETFVDEGNLTRAIHTLRKVLGEDQNGNKFIETVAKKGYRFVAETVAETDPTEPDLESGRHLDSPKYVPYSASDALPTRKSVPRAARPIGRTLMVGSGLLLAVLAVAIGTGFFDRPAKVRSIAVLPLRPLIPESRDPIYELGIANSLILKLRSAKGVEVRPLSVTQAYIDKNIDPILAGREQGVDHILASEYQIADGKIRIDSRLINVSTGVMEAEFRDEQVKSTIFTVQDQVAANIGHRLLRWLERTPGNGKSKEYTTNEEAYGYYWLGQSLVEKQNAKDAEKAIVHLERSVELDPNYALAYAALSAAHGTLAMSGGDKREHYIKQRAAIDKALAIDEDLPEAHARLGMIKMNQDWDFDGAERALLRALELDPESALAHRDYAVFLNSMGRFDESITQIKAALKAEPTSLLNNRTYGMILYYARRYDKAIEQLERTIDLDPDFRGAYGFLCRSYRMNGENDKAFKCFLRSPARNNEDASKIELWKTIYSNTGWNGVLQQTIEDAKLDENSSKLSPWDLANIYGELGERDKAFAVIEKGLGRGGWGWTVTKVNPSLDSLRSDPRFAQLLQRIGLS